jgi:hypothetical protein
VNPDPDPAIYDQNGKKIKAEFFFYQYNFFLLEPHKEFQSPRPYEKTSSSANYENLSILKISWCHAFGLSCSRIHRFCTGVKASFKVGLKGVMTPYPPTPFNPTLTPF